MPAHGWLLQEIGTVFGGMIALLAKSATAGAVQSAASAGTRFTALDLKVNFLRAVDADGTELLAKGKVVHRGSRQYRGNPRRADSSGRNRNYRARCAPLSRSSLATRPGPLVPIGLHRRARAGVDWPDRAVKAIYAGGHLLLTGLAGSFQAAHGPNPLSPPLGHTLDAEGFPPAPKRAPR